MSRNVKKRKINPYWGCQFYNYHRRYNKEMSKVQNERESICLKCYEKEKGNDDKNWRELENKNNEERSLIHSKLELLEDELINGIIDEDYDSLKEAAEKRAKVLKVIKEEIGVLRDEKFLEILSEIRGRLD